MDQHVRKAVFPVAGLGTRFLPATKANPKEMLPIVDKPLIQYAAEEAINAGITQLVFVTSSTKRAIEDHFDKNYELEAELEKKGRYELLSLVRNIVPSNVSCVYVRQPEALGLGHAVLCAESVVGDEPFAVILADDLIDDPGRGCLQQLVDKYSQVQSAILGVETIPPQDTNKYGIVAVEAPNSVFSKVTSIVEKPESHNALSNIAIVGRYILPAKIFSLIRSLPRGAGNEIQLTDAIARLTQLESVYALRFEGKRYDCGNKMGYLEATINYALKHHDLSKDFRLLLNKYSSN